MSKISSNLVNEFVKAINNNTVVSKAPTTLKGTAKIVGGKLYAVLDGSDILTPVKTTVACQEGNRVEVRIYDHQATITGNLSDVSVGEGTANDIIDKAFDSFTITNSNFIDGTISGSIFQEGTIDGSKIKDSTITGSQIADSTITGSNIQEGTITGSAFQDGSIDGSKITNSTITGSQIADSTITGSNIQKGTITGAHISQATFDQISGEAIDAVHAEFDEVISGKLSADEAELMFAKIDLTNINEGCIKTAYIEDAAITSAKIADGSIENAKIKDGAISNAKIADAEITAAKIHDINADTITAGTLKTERLILVDDETGEESIVKAINAANGVATPNGTKFQAASIDVIDLNAFQATIGGFTIGQTSLYNAKDAIDNPNSGVYIGLDGIGVGDGNTQGLTDKSPFMVKADGTFWVGGNNGSIFFDPFTGKLAMNVSEMKIESTDVGLALGQIEDLEERVTNNTTQIIQNANEVKIAFSTIGEKLDENDEAWNELQSYIRFVDGNVELGESSSDFKTILSNEELAFMQGANKIAFINNNTMHITKAEISDEIKINNWVWMQRDSGNLSLRWRI